MCSPNNFAKVLGTPILCNDDGRLILKYLLKIKIAAPDKLLVLVGKFREKKKQKYVKQST